MHTVPKSVTLSARKYKINMNDVSIENNLSLFLLQVPSQWHTSIKIKAWYLVLNVKLVLPLDDFRHNIFALMVV
jgi:hypothetical protein